MRRFLVRILLAALNSRFLNNSPCEYGFIGNVDAFSIENLRSEESQRPGITVATIIREAEIFKCCPIGSGVTVMQENESPREADVWDLHELRTSLDPNTKL